VPLVEAAQAEPSHANVANAPAPGAPLPGGARTGACVLCGSRGDPVVFSENGYDGRHCACGIVYIDPLPEGGVCDATVDSHIADYYALAAAVRMDWIQRLVPRGRLLEVGCGDGALVAEALARGYSVEAIEPHPEAAAHVASTFGIPVECCMLDDTRLPRETYDVVFHVDLLSHFHDPVAALRTMAALARSDGVVCFEVGLFGGLSPRWYPWVGRPGFPAHRWFFSENALGALVARAGLRITSMRRFSIAPSTVLSSALQKALPRRIRSVRESTGRAPRGTAIQRLYARLHHVLRYRLGSSLSMSGPQTCFVGTQRVTACGLVGASA
jgi:SAM-dependent methyltransferase